MALTGARHHLTGARQHLTGARHQIVAAEVAAALLLAASTRGFVALAGAVPVAAGIVAVTWVRVRGRRLYQWLAIGMRYASRRRTLPAGADPAALLDLVQPGAEVVPAELDHDPAAVISDGYGLTAVIELGDPAVLLADTVDALPSPAALLPTAAPDIPHVRVQLLITAFPAPAGGGIPASSYRQLTEGRLLSQLRVVVAVRVLRAEGWSEPDLRRSLSGLVRKVRRRLAPVPSRPLGEAAALGVLADLAHHDGAQPAREAWQATQLGGLWQTTFRLRRTRLPHHSPPPTPKSGLVPRVLTLPAAATTVSVVADTAAAGVDIVVRLAAVDAAGLAIATQALRRLLTGVHRLEGEQLDGLAATLPLGGAPVAPIEVDTLDLPLGGDGLMIGANRYGAPVMLRLFRPEPTRMALIGGVRVAQLLAMRAMALGARVIVQTSRPYAWEPFVRGVSTPGGKIGLVAAGRPLTLTSGTPLCPLLLIVDTGPAGATEPTDGAFAGAGWQTTLVVRDELAPVDLDLLARADLVVLQPLRPDEAALAAGTLGLGEAQDWLTRIREDMVGVVNRRSVRWALLSATPIERQLVGTTAR